MSQFTLTDLEKTLNAIKQNDHASEAKPYALVEAGYAKPYNPATIAAARRRGYRVTKAGAGLYRVYPKV